MTRDDLPLRVLYSFPHPLGGSGIGTTAMQQVRGLVAAGADVAVVCTSLAVAAPAGVQVVETLRLAGRRVPHRALGVERAWGYHDWVAARLLQRVSRPPDVVHVWPQATLRTASAARRAGVRSFREVPNTHTANAYEQAEHEGALTHTLLATGASHAPSASRLAREEAEYQSVTRLVVPSDAVADTFLSRGFGEAQLARSVYGYDPQRFSPAPARPSGPFTAVFVGTGEPRKGLHYALEAWHASGAADRGRFLIYGSLVPGYAAHLERWLQHPSVELCGFTADVPAVMRSADVLMLPSVEEGSALVSYEAMGSGCVPLVSVAVGARCVDGVSGLVHPTRDVGALTAQLQAVSSDASLLARLRAGAIEAAADLTWEVAGRRLLELYRANA